MKYNRIKELRQDADLYQWQVAKAIKVSQRACSSYETGERKMSTDIVEKFAGFYGTSVDYLLYRTDEKKPYPKSRKLKLLKEITGNG